MNDKLIDYLLGEIRELLTVGPVGLYEFPESLRYRYPDLPWEEQLRVSRAALQVILTSGEAHLVWEVWAQAELTRDAEGTVPTDNAFETLSEDPADLHKPYLSIAPTIAERSRRQLHPRVRRDKSNDR